MSPEGKKLLQLMFREVENVCVSDSQYGFHSIPLEKLLSNEQVTLVSPNSQFGPRSIDTDKLTMLALNPIQGFREDANCTSFRNFLIEIDTGSIKEQYKYIKALNIPYSAIIFSGNKSLHTLISLEKDLPNEKAYREIAEWILNIVTLADQATKNPSRSIRIPGAYREPDKKQSLVEMVGPTSLAALKSWLMSYPASKPKKYEKRQISENPDFSLVKPWAAKLLMDGISEDRNKTWFKVAVEFFLAGYSLDDIIEKLSMYFTPERDFKEREWITTLKSAEKFADKKR